MLICAAFSDAPTTLFCPQTNRDIEATAACLRALGAKISYKQGAYYVVPCTKMPKTAELPCDESGSTLRFLLPVVGALGVDAVFHLDGRLPQRPLSHLWEEMERMGCTLTKSEKTITCTGQLKSGAYAIDGSVSSQFISGLMLALPLINGESTLQITGKIESAPYIALTKQVISLFGINHYRSPGTLTVEGDWSNAAFFLAADALGNDLKITNLNYDSCQGDRAVVDILSRLLKETCTVNAADIPDLIPILSVVAAANHGARFTQIKRLRLKESDRIAAIAAMLHNLGCTAEASEDTLTVHPGTFTGGTVDGFNDHRIVMSAAIAATLSSAPVTILGAEAVDKSYPQFWAEYRRLGGQYEQYIRE